jgi:hypothetical protein
MEDRNFLVDVGSDKRAARALWEMGVRKKYKIAQVSSEKPGLGTKDWLTWHDTVSSEHGLTDIAPIRSSA